MKFVLCCALALYLREVAGHGMMLDPPNRSSLWRFVPGAPQNYDDNANSCGGITIQHEINGGKCGVCGDSYTDPHPQKNENTGIYGGGVVVRKYEAGSVINVNILLTANHMGTFRYYLCELQNHNAPESGEECFKQLLLEDGSGQYNVKSEDKTVVNRVRLPNKACERCVLRWVYRGGYNIGKCDDGTRALGCGPQVHFMSCSDITILPTSANAILEPESPFL